MFKQFYLTCNETLTGSTTPGQSEPGIKDNEGGLHIPQSSKAKTSPSEGFVSYPGHWLAGSYSSTEDVFSRASRLGCLFIKYSNVI